MAHMIMVDNKETRITRLTVAEFTRLLDKPMNENEKLVEVLLKVRAIIKAPWHPDSDVGPGDALLDLELEAEIDAALKEAT